MATVHKSSESAVLFAGLLFSNVHVSGLCFIPDAFFWNNALFQAVGILDLLALLLLFSQWVLSNSFATLWIVAHQAPLSVISQAKKLEWVAISFSRGSPWPKPTSPVLQVDSLPFSHQESPYLPVNLLYVPVNTHGTSVMNIN